MDVIKKNGEWVYNKDFKDGDVISIPYQCQKDVCGDKEAKNWTLGDEIKFITSNKNEKRNNKSYTRYSKEI